MRYRAEPSYAYPLAYRVVDTRWYVGDPAYILVDNVSRARAGVIAQEAEAGDWN
jgi:hypothetical protein